jgi:hypothetical protein
MLECVMKDFEGITKRGNAIVIKGQTFNLDGNETAYDVVMDNVSFTSRNLFDAYVRQLGLTKAQFNRRINDKEDVNLDDIKMIVRRVNNNFEVYQYDKPGCNQISLVTSTNDKAFETKMVNFLQFNCGNKYFLNLSMMKARQEAKKLILNDKYRKDFQVKLISNDYIEYCSTYIGLDSILDDGECPSWENFIKQFKLESERRAFMCFIYSIFNSGDTGRQIMWLNGIGNSGKTTIVNIIYEKLSEFNEKLVKSISNTKSFEGDKFNTSGLDTCRLTIISDTRDRKLLERPFILQLSGADVVTVRSMYQDVKTVRAYSKIIAVSNFAPMVDMTARHEVTRCLYLALDDKLCQDSYSYWHNNNLGDWKNALRTEFGSFLNKCKNIYDSCMLPDFTIPTPQDLLEKMSLECSANYRNIIDAFRDNFCVIEESSQLELTDLVSVVHKFIGKTTYISKDFREEVLKSFMLKFKTEEQNVSGIKTVMVKGLRLVKKARYTNFSEWISLTARSIDMKID